MLCSLHKVRFFSWVRSECQMANLGIQKNCSKVQNLMFNEVILTIRETSVKLPLIVREQSDLNIIFLAMNIFPNTIQLNPTCRG